jgi:hypothetical protein
MLLDIFFVGYYCCWQKCCFLFCFLFWVNMYIWYVIINILISDYFSVPIKYCMFAFPRRFVVTICEFWFLLSGVRILVLSVGGSAWLCYYVSLCILWLLVMSVSCNSVYVSRCLVLVWRVWFSFLFNIYEGVSKRFWTGRLEWELQMVQLSASRCICIATLWVSVMSFAIITLCVASQLMFIIVIVVYFVIDSVRKLLAIASYVSWNKFN